ncbi:hypothetical protein [Mucilaginibacter sp.]|uniref:hypothetical protein n=1 Tax=Mucilaginibacter sp. TaxID=1882438 RepID=UPI0026396F0B|nr:hypothetical protein [Mucilaginibacter sp.]MDB4923489.1 hypothetical protein [Mucilaginibacter sp.]
MINLKRNPVNRLYRYVLLLPFIVLSLCFINPAKAGTVPLKTTIADTTSMKAFEGIYQLKSNAHGYIQITVADKTLLAKIIDGNKQFVLTRKGDLTFETLDSDGDETIPITFAKSDAGEITGAAVGDKDQLTRVKNYVPVKELKLTAAQLKAYEGKYEFEERKGTFLTITATADGLVLKQLWDDREIPFIAVADNEFLNKEAMFPLKFTMDANGNAIKVLAFNRDSWDKVKE